MASRHPRPVNSKTWPLPGKASWRHSAQGECLGRDNVAIKRPGHGIQPRDLEKVMGLRVTTDIEADRVVTWADLK